MVEYQEGIRTKYPRIVPASIGLLVVGILGAAAVSGPEPEWPLRIFSAASFVGFVGLGSLFAERYKRIVLTQDRLSVGREVYDLTNLVGPVITGDEAVELAGSIASNPLAGKENEQLRLLGGSKATTLGQQPVLVQHRISRKLLVICSWQPDKLAAALDRCIALNESKGQEA